jgi:hypothetical protein
VRLQFFVADAEVLDRDAVRQEFPAVALFVVAAQAQLDRIDAEMHARPMQPGAADTRARKERAELTVRQRGVVHAVADRHGLARDVLE